MEILCLAVDLGMDFLPAGGGLFRRSGALRSVLGRHMRTLQASFWTAPNLYEAVKRQCC